METKVKRLGVRISNSICLWHGELLNTNALFNGIANDIIDGTIVVKPKESEESRLITVRIPTKQYSKLSKIAKKHNISVQELLRLGLDKITI